MSWSINEVARMSGVTSRTLRHYDAIGLLRPASVDAAGRRHYGRAELLRLQRILLLRELGLGLAAIAGVLSREVDATEALRGHRDWLVAERDRLDRLVRTVEATIERGTEMAADRLFAGFEDDPHEAQARERWGDEAVDAAYRRMAGWTPEDAERARTGYATVHEGLAALRAANVPAGDARAQELVRLHHEVTCLFWTPTAEAYRALGATYVADERFRRSIGGGDDGLVEYLRDAMAAYADSSLS